MCFVWFVVCVMISAQKSEVVKGKQNEIAAVCGYDND
jgi:hypothetical protein